MMALIQRRKKLFIIMFASLISIIISGCIDLYIYKVLKIMKPADISQTMTIIVTICKLLYYNLVNTFIYYIMYWSYRHTYESTNGVDI